MRSASRTHLSLTTLVALCVTSCYAHYAWIGVDRGAAFSDEEKRAAVGVAASVAERLGLRSSWMQGLAPARMTEENPFQELALFQGTGENRNLLLTVAVKDDGSQLRFWISDLDHSQETKLVRDLVNGLKDELARLFPDRRFTVGDGRRLRLYAG